MREVCQTHSRLAEYPAIVLEPPYLKMHTSYYKMILFSGSERISFLQGQLTQDVEKLHNAGSLPAAWCNPKGRVIVTAQLINLDDVIGMAVPSAMIDTIVTRLIMYRLQADVQIEIGDDNCVKDSFESAGMDVVDSPDIQQWQQGRVAAGIVDIFSENSEQYTPHMLNLDLIGAVSFDKGCYTGQEIVARTENLGKVKRRINRYRLADCSAEIGDKLSDGDRDAGKIVNVGNNEVLAVTAVDQHGKMLRLGTGTATPLALPYKMP